MASIAYARFDDESQNSITLTQSTGTLRLKIGDCISYQSSFNSGVRRVKKILSFKESATNSNKCVAIDLGTELAAGVFANKYNETGSQPMVITLRPKDFDTIAGPVDCRSSGGKRTRKSKRSRKTRKRTTKV